MKVQIRLRVWKTALKILRPITTKAKQTRNCRNQLCTYGRSRAPEREGPQHFRAPAHPNAPLRRRPWKPNSWSWSALSRSLSLSLGSPLVFAFYGLTFVFVLVFHCNAYYLFLGVRYGVYFKWVFSLS